MKAVLSPLFSIQRFCKHCATAYYKQNPGHWLWLYELERMPPLGMFDPREGFMPDLPVLLMFDEFAIDSEAAERISSMPHNTWLGQWPDVISYLRAEGALQETDFISVRKQIGSKRGHITRQDMATPAEWLHAMHVHDSLMGSAEQAFTEVPTASEPINWHFDPKKEGTVRGDDGLLHSFRALMEDSTPPDAVHAKLLPDALGHMRRQLSEVNAGILIADHLGGVPMFWAPYREYYKIKAAGTPAVQNATESSEAARVFFDVAFPRFKPDTVGHLCSLRRDPRLRALRDEIIRASRSGQALDPEYPQAILQEVLKTDRSIERVRRITSWISSAVGLIPGASLPATAAADVATSAIAARKRKRIEWMYVISDGVGHS